MPVWQGVTKVKSPVSRVGSLQGSCADRQQFSSQAALSQLAPGGAVVLLAEAVKSMHIACLKEPAATTCRVIVWLFYSSSPPSVHPHHNCYTCLWVYISMYSCSVCHHGQGVCALCVWQSACCVLPLCVPDVFLFCWRGIIDMQLHQGGIAGGSLADKIIPRHKRWTGPCAAQPLTV